MTHRTVICVFVVGVVGVALACSLFQDDPEIAQGSVPAQSQESGEIVQDFKGSKESVVDPNYSEEGPTISAPSNAAAREAGTTLPSFEGVPSLEERILNYPTVVRATLDRVTSEVIEAGGYWAGKYVIVVKFHLTVSEYLKGSGATNIIAVWGSNNYDSRSDAEVASPSIVAQRNTRWDDTEAIFFMNSEPWETFRAVKAEGTYFMHASAIELVRDDFISVDSRYNRLWLPIAPSSTGTGDDKRFLLEAPEDHSAAQQQAEGVAARNATSTRPLSAYAQAEPSTITLGDLKAKIAAINAEIDAGDGSEDYRKCIVAKYFSERSARHRASEGRTPGHIIRDYSTVQTITSGMPTGTIIYEDKHRGKYPDEKYFRTWFEGEYAALFELVDGSMTPIDRNNDGVLTADVDYVEYAEWLKSTRPLPTGKYTFNVNDLSDVSVPCNDVNTHEWTVTVYAPAGVLHELFFDPVTVGKAVVADETNGVLKPASFTGANGGSATLNSISYESGTVTIGVTPDDALAGHVVDFIELDGSVSLSLDVADATVDAANDTLSWSVESQPWDDGDLLMVRVR